MASSSDNSAVNSWRERWLASRRLVIAAIASLLCAALALWWAESRELSRVHSLSEGASNVTQVDVGVVRPELEGKLLHVSGLLTGDTLRDENLGVAVPALRLHRSVEMFQWEEREEEIGTGNQKKKVKSYVKKWSEALIASRAFEPGHENPSALPYVEREVSVDRATLGAFVLPKEGVLSLSNFEPLPATQEMRELAPRDVRGRMHVEGGVLYLGRDPQRPDIGDCRITFQVVHPQTVSILAEQHGAELIPHRTRSGGTVFVVHPGLADSAALFGVADLGTSVLTWSLRGIALVLLGFAFTLFSSRLPVGRRIAPRVGRFVLPGLALLGLSSAAVILGVTVGSVWLQDRPWSSAIAFAFAGLGLFALVWFGLRARRAVSSA